MLLTFLNYVQLYRSKPIWFDKIIIYKKSIASSQDQQCGENGLLVPLSVWRHYSWLWCALVIVAIYGYLRLAANLAALFVHQGFFAFGRCAFRVQAVLCSHSFRRVYFRATRWIVRIAYTLRIEWCPGCVACGVYVCAHSRRMRDRWNVFIYNTKWYKHTMRISLWETYSISRIWLNSDFSLSAFSHWATFKTNCARNFVCLGVSVCVCVRARLLVVVVFVERTEWMSHVKQPKASNLMRLT